jgi:phage gpG-like protein
MAIDLVLTWDGLDADAYARRFRTAASIETFYPVLQEIGAIGIAPAIQKNFDAGGRPKWAPLAEATIKKKMQMSFFSPRKILVATSAMMASATDPGRYVITSHTIIAEPGPHYWIYHQTGTNRMPQRVIMNLQIADQRKIGGLFDRYILEHLRKNGLKVMGVVTEVGGGGA